MENKAKELLKKLKEDGIEKYNYTDKALELIREYDQENITDFGLTDDNDIEYIIKKEVEEYGWERVACFLSDAELNSPYGYRIDAYGNLQNIRLEDIIIWLEYIVEN